MEAGVHDVGGDGPQPGMGREAAQAGGDRGRPR